VSAFADKHRGTLRWEPPARGVLYGFFEDTRGRDLQPILEEGARREGVLAVPGAFFGIPAGFRLSWTLPFSQLGEGLRRLERVLELTS
jgi:aspartate/methionine/tyrosine aminotransferase